MIKTIIFIILLTNTTLTKSLAFPEAKADFLQKIQTSIKDLQVKSKLDKPDEISLQYYFVDTSTSRAIHAVDISYTLKKGENPTLLFTQAKRQDLKKVILSYYKEEMAIQWPILNELASRMLIAPPLGKKDDKLYLNLLSDVRMKIKENYKDMKTEISFVDDNIVRMELYSEESMVCFFNVKVVSEVVVKSKSEHFNETNYFMDIEMFLSQHNKQESKSVKIDMITEDGNLFGRKIKEILGHIDLEKFVNNNSGGLNNVGSYFKKHLINVAKTSNANLKESVTFDIVFENQKAKGILNYLPPKPQDLTNIGSYNLKLIKDGEEVKSLDFKRMSIVDFEKFMKENEIEKIFKSMYEEIMEMFKKKYAETHKPEFNAYNLVDVKKEVAMFGNGNPQKGLASKAGQNLLLEFLYAEDKNGLVNILFDAKSPFFKLEQSFVKMMYKKEVVSAWIDYILTHHIILKKSNAVDVAKKLRLI